MSRGRLIYTQLLVFVFALGIFAVSATACEGVGGGGGELTSLSTKLSGGGKEGEELTVSEGTVVKDKATLTGKNASKATGKVAYNIYSEKNCTTLATFAGEVTVSGESVPASSEENLEAGKTYYWQAHYRGDSENDESTSPCTEILNVKAKTSLSTELSGESSKGGEITILEGAKAKDKATLLGTNSSTASGKVLYEVFSDKECKTLVVAAGEVTVSSGVVPASSEELLEGGKTYYWQAIYKGDSLHEESTSSCGSEVLKIKAKTTLSATLASGAGEEHDEGEELTVDADQKVKDTATLGGTNSSSASGKALYKIYSNKECTTLVKEAGEVTVSSGSIPASIEEELEGNKTYYWQTTYKGDSLHQESKSICGKVIEIVIKCTAPYCEPTATPGVRIHAPGGECTAGPVMVKGTEKFVLTAGHCFGESTGTETIAAAVQSAYPKEAAKLKEIGKSVTFNNTSSYDTAEVKVENSEWLLAGGGLPPVLIEWKTAPQTRSIVGKTASKVGEKTCLTGAGSESVNCGEILRTGVTFEGTSNLVETTALVKPGDSGAPEFIRTTNGVLIQGTVVGLETGISGEAKLTSGSNTITEFPKETSKGDLVCKKIEELKTRWHVPIEGSGIPAKAIVEECKEVGSTDTITISAKATVSAKAFVTIGYPHLGFYEPISQIEAVYPGQTLLVK